MLLSPIQLETEVGQDVSQTAGSAGLWRVCAQSLYYLFPCTGREHCFGPALAEALPGQWEPRATASESGCCLTDTGPGVFAPNLYIIYFRVLRGPLGSRTGREPNGRTGAPKILAAPV